MKQLPFRGTLAMLALLPALSLAQSIVIPVGTQGSKATLLPENGTTKRIVLEQYGLADQEHAAVGQPPIQRWDYRDFSVYFENDRVINSVRHHQTRLQKEE
jgi:hypothetical protein